MWRFYSSYQMTPYSAEPHGSHFPRNVTMTPLSVCFPVYKRFSPQTFTLMCSIFHSYRNVLDQYHLLLSFAQYRSIDKFPTVGLTICFSSYLFISLLLLRPYSFLSFSWRDTTTSREVEFLFQFVLFLRSLTSVRMMPLATCLRSCRRCHQIRQDALSSPRGTR